MTWLEYLESKGIDPNEELTIETKKEDGNVSRETKKDAVQEDVVVEESKHENEILETAKLLKDASESLRLINLDKAISGSASPPKTPEEDLHDFMTNYYK